MAQSEQQIVRGMFGTDLNQINVLNEIQGVTNEINSGRLNAADKATAINYLAGLRKKAGTSYDGGAGYQSTVDKYFGIGGSSSGGKADDSAPGANDVLGPYIGNENRWNAKDVNNIPPTGSSENESDGIWNKIKGVVGNVGLVILGIGISGIAIYFAAKKVSES